jgi:hypothetical protein
MKKIITKIIWFALPLIALFFLGLLLPPTPRASTSLLFADQQKDSLLRNVASPRIIFVGGSSVSFGLNSQVIKDSLHLNPINTGVHASIGLKYMMENTAQYIKKGDIVVLMPEYQLLYEDYNDVSEELARTIFDVNKSKYRLLNFKQRFALLPYTPKIALSKFNPREYSVSSSSNQKCYLISAFNQYGDTYVHWGLPREIVSPSKISGNLNKEVMNKIAVFQSEIEKRGATLYISYPGFQDISFFKSKEAIDKIEQEYIKRGFRILGTPERYMMPDSLMYNTNYHLNKEGADRRTKLLIEDLRFVLNDFVP